MKSIRFRQFLNFQCIHFKYWKFSEKEISMSETKSTHEPIKFRHFIKKFKFKFFNSLYPSNNTETYAMTRKKFSTLSAIFCKHCDFTQQEKQRFITRGWKEEKQRGKFATCVEAAKIRPSTKFVQGEESEKFSSVFKVFSLWYVGSFNALI